jgi:hypothetical protein
LTWSRLRRRCRRDGGTHGCITPGDERREAEFENASIEKNVAGATLATESDVGAEPIHQPVRPTTRMGPPEPDDIAQK